ncbi:ankyrin repeat-containing domain protein [Aspergillus filifer]
MIAQMVDSPAKASTPLTLELPSGRNMEGHENSSSIDIATRRRIQNRNAQRKFRARQRKAKEMQEQGSQGQNDETSQQQKEKRRSRQQEKKLPTSPFEITGATVAETPFAYDVDWIAQLCSTAETMPLTLPDLSPTSMPPFDMSSFSTDTSITSSQSPARSQSLALLPPHTQRPRQNSGFGISTAPQTPVSRGITTALHIAVEHEHGNLVQMLLAHEPQQYSVQDSRGRTALHIAAQRSLRDILVKLLAMETDMEMEAPGSDEDSGFGSSSGSGSGSATPTRTLDLRDADGQTALYIATERGQEAMVQELLRYGANPNIGDWSGKRPLHIATLRGDKVILE